MRYTWTCKSNLPRRSTPTFDFEFFLSLPQRERERETESRLVAWDLPCVCCTIDQTNNWGQVMQNRRLHKQKGDLLSNQACLLHFSALSLTHLALSRCHFFDFDPDLCSWECTFSSVGSHKENHRSLQTSRTSIPIVKLLYSASATFRFSKKCLKRVSWTQEAYRRLLSRSGVLRSMKTHTLDYVAFHTANVVRNYHKNIRRKYKQARINNVAITLKFSQDSHLLLLFWHHIPLASVWSETHRRGNDRTEIVPERVELLYWASGDGFCILSQNYG